MTQLIRQVLYDALSHGFVGMNKITLMVFDEGMFVEHECLPYKLLVAQAGF